MITANATSRMPFRHRGEPEVADSSPLPRGRVLGQTVAGDPRQRYFLYLPKACGEGSRVLVSVHGISRNALEHVSAFQALAERHNFILVAPLFSAERFSDYQRLGRVGAGPRADLALNRILRDVTGISGVDSERFYLFGFSGGGQFAHRYAFAYPHRVLALIVGAAGWYTLPDPGRGYPKGTANAVGLPGIVFNPQRYLKVPVCVLVGEHDTMRDRELKKSRWLDREQGVDRVERGRSWVKALRAAAAARGLHTRFQFELVPGVGHSFLESQRSDQFCELFSRLLLSVRPASAVESGG